MSTYDEIQALVKTAREAEGPERQKALCNLWLLDAPLDAKAQDFLEQVFISVGRDTAGDLQLFQSVSVALAKYGDLQRMVAGEFLWPRLIRWVEEVAVMPSSTGGKADLGDLLAFEALAGLSRFLEHRSEVSGELIRIVGEPDHKGAAERFSDLQKEIHLYLRDDALIAVGALGDQNGADFLKRWRDSGNLSAAAALEHFGRPFDAIKEALSALEEQGKKEGDPEGSEAAAVKQCARCRCAIPMDALFCTQCGAKQ